MHISRLRIRNFRNFRSAKFVLRDGVNTLIGENGSGKTNAFYAMRLLLDESLSRKAARLKATDFCRSLGEWQGHWIMIAIDFDELDPSEGCQILKHEAGHMNGTESGTYMLSFRPTREVRKALFDLTENASSPEDFKTYLGALTANDYEPVFSGRAQADFLDDKEYAAIAGDHDAFIFPDPDEDDLATLGVPTSTPIHAEITCTFVQALRDAVSDLRGFRNNPLLALLTGTESEIAEEDAERISEAVAGLNRDISSLSQIQEIASGIQSTLLRTVGHTFSPAVGIESMLPDQLDKLLQRLAVNVGDDIEVDYRGDLSELSLGGANLIYLALKLLEYELKLSSDRGAHFLLIEEPEAHIHSHVQKTLFRSQSTHRTQVLLSTHSTHISSAATISAVNVLARDGAEAHVYQPASDLAPEVVSRAERYLDAVRSTLLFAKGVVLVEGEAELVLIPAMLRAVFGVSLDELGVSVISMNSAFFQHVAVIFDDKRIRRRCSIVTDGDDSLIDLSTDPADDTPKQSRARASRKSGAERRAALNAFCADNRWVQPFYAEHTLEIEFIREDNSPEVVATLPNIYSKQAYRKSATTRLESEDLAEAGAEALRLANKTGKGWFALLLAEQLRADTVIPDYILRAVAFAAAGNATYAIFRKMAAHRVAGGQADAEALDALDAHGDATLLGAIEILRNHAAEDPVTILLQYVAEYSL